MIKIPFIPNDRLPLAVSPPQINRPFSWWGSPRSIPEARVAGQVVLVAAAMLSVYTTIISLIFGAHFVLFNVTSPDEVQIFSAVVQPLVLCGQAVYLRSASERAVERLPAVYVFVGIVLTVFFGISTKDTTVLGQILYFLPQLFAVYALPRTPAFAFLALTVSGHGLHLAVVDRSYETLNEWLVVSILLLGLTHTLSRTRDVQDVVTSELLDQTERDSLTGLLRRQRFRELIHGAMNHEKSSPGASIISVDVDNFKKINDTFGHPVGDQVLQHVANALCEICDHDGLASRLGGDEFGVFLMPSSAEHGELVAQKVVDYIAEHHVVFTDRLPLPITVSVGVSHWPTDTANPKRLYSISDSAMILAKREGRNQVATGKEFIKRGRSISEP